MTDWTSLNRLMNVLKGECLWIWLLEISINVNMFTFIIVAFVVVFLFTCFPFFMLVFVVILSSTIICKQVCLLALFSHFVAFVYNFNVKRCKGKWILYFRNNMKYGISWRLVISYNNICFEFRHLDRGQFILSTEYPLSP